MSQGSASRRPLLTSHHLHFAHWQDRLHRLFINHSFDRRLQGLCAPPTLPLLSLSANCKDPLRYESHSHGV